MKTTTLILIIIFGSFLSINSSAQTATTDKSNCSCKKKTVYHKPHKKATTTVTAVAKKPQVPACYSKPGMVMGDCPTAFSNNSGCIYDSAGNIAYVIENNYLGYYPELTVDVMESVPAYKSLAVTSPAFKNYGSLPSKYSCEGTKVSPPLTIGNIPADTKALAIILFDPSATPNGDARTYWVAWDIDTTSNIPENFVNDHMALNSSMEYGYQAVCPIGGSSHYYHFMVYALDTKLIANKHATRSMIEEAMKGHILASDELVGVYNRVDYNK